MTILLGPRHPDVARIRDYYDQTWLDYRLLWLRPENGAIHFGYWDEQTRDHATSLLTLNRVLAHQLDLRPGERVLDAGCGIGGGAIWLAEHYPVTVTGINIVPGQLARARQAAERRGVADRVTFAHQDYTQTTFPDDSFDAVWAVESLCHAPEKWRFFAETRRLLRPGGRLLVAEYMRVDRPLIQPDEDVLHSWLSGWAIPDIATREELTGWARDAGFEGVAIRDITPRMAPSLRRLGRMAAFGWPIERTLHAAGLRSDTQHGNVRGARDQYRALQRGCWLYGVLTANVPDQGIGPVSAPATV